MRTLIICTFLGGGAAYSKPKVVVFPLVSLADEVDASITAEMNTAIISEFKLQQSLQTIPGRRPEDMAVAVASRRQPARSRDTYRKAIGRLIGNAVPVNLGKAIGRSIVRHVQKYDQTKKRAA